ncbi:uncharacterized protein LOC110987526 isoform X2 [Acanthaster planci]|uniref:Uncharacterized protein LOC110987526 isoform X2 n=1 Tax=Acanthaster planci TaxID=133434 RepID=A0A8B7ZK58_ACAPL|nr:uncharacterized protein LOC110987526 isoform X2 [Acanthaster planci]
MSVLTETFRKPNRSMPVLMTTPSPSSHASFPVTTSGGDTVHAASLSPSRPAERMRLRPWLIRNIEEKTIPGLEWLDKEERLVKIPWKHAARHGWTCDKDASLFRAWAIHTKKYDPISNTPKANPKIWKANFRCAINSLPDILEVKGQGKSKGNDAFKIYKLIPKKARRTRTPSDGKTSQKKSGRLQKSRVARPTERHRPQPSSSQMFPKSSESVSAGSLSPEQYVNSLLHSRLHGYPASFWDEPIRNDISQSQRTTEQWGPTITYTNRHSPIRHDLSLYPTPPSSNQSTNDPLNLSSAHPSEVPVSSPPAYPHHGRGMYPSLYAISSSRRHESAVGSRGSELMEYIAEGRQRTGEIVSADGYQEQLHDAESNCSSIPSDEEIVDIVDDMTKNSPMNSPTRTSPFDGNNNSNSSSYWQTSTLDNKHFLSDERMIPSTSELSMRPPPPDYNSYQNSSHAFKVESRASCEYMKPEVYRDLTEGNRITETSSGTCFYVM